MTLNSCGTLALMTFTKVFKAFGVEFRILADHRIIYQVGESWQCSDIEDLERKAEQMLLYRKKTV